jgi:hypothetical protein
LAEAAIVLGNSPGTFAGSPMRVRSVGSEGEIERREIVLEPALTAKMSCVMCQLKVSTKLKSAEWTCGTYISNDHQ